MPKYLSLVLIGGRALVSLKLRDKEGADTAERRLFKQYRQREGLALIQTEMPLKNRGRNARS